MEAICSLKGVSFLLWKEGEEYVTAKNLKQAESPTCTKTEHTFAVKTLELLLPLQSIECE